MIFFDPIYVLALLLSSAVMWLLIPERFRTWFITLGSVLLLARIQLQFTLFLVGFIVAIFYAGELLKRGPTLLRFMGPTLALVIVLIAFKYIGVIFSTIFSAENAFSKSYLVPIGISYLSFKLISYIIEIYRGTISNPSLSELLAFILFVPTFQAGPIERYANFAWKRRTTFDQEWCLAGLKRISIGYFKKIVLVNFLLNELLYRDGLFNLVTAGGVSFDLPAGIIIIYLLAILLYAYIDISSYADLAIGFGRLFGYQICENMNYPLFARNVSEYWTRWHMSLSFWCRDNVYFPVLGATRRVNLALYASFLVMGLWHYINFNWLLWGLWHATGIILFKIWDHFKRRHKGIKRLMPARIGSVLGAVLTVSYSAMGYAFVSMPGAKGAARLLLALVL